MSFVVRVSSVNGDLISNLGGYRPTLLQLAGVSLNATLLGPTLSETMIQRLMPFGSVELVEAGAALVSRGGRLDDLVVLLEGALDVFARRGKTEVGCTLTGRGQFAGGSPSVADGVAATAGWARVESKVLRIARSRFRSLLVAEVDIGEIVVRATLHRRLALNGNGVGRAGNLVDCRSRPRMRFLLTIGAKAMVLAWGLARGADVIDSAAHSVLT